MCAEHSHEKASLVNVSISPLLPEEEQIQPDKSMVEIAQKAIEFRDED